MSKKTTFAKRKGYIHRKSSIVLALPHDDRGEWKWWMNDPMKKNEWTNAPPTPQLSKRESRKTRRECMGQNDIQFWCFLVFASKTWHSKTGCSTPFEISHTLPFQAITISTTSWQNKWLGRKDKKEGSWQFWWVLPMTHVFSQTGSSLTFPPPYP